jgi:zinc/manganese transport system substrate-binding protein
MNLPWNRLWLALCLVPWFAFGSRAAADELPLRVLVTVPDLADIVRQVGGERVEVTAIARGTENVHSVALRPSVLVAAHRADLFVQVGLSLEHAWVPGLLDQARNPRIQPGAPGFVNAGEGFPALEVPEHISRGHSADVHPQGNPHVNLDPRAGGHFAAAVLAGLLRVDPEHGEHYRERHAAYARELARAAERWAPQLARLRGRQVVAYHGEFAYLAAAAGIEVVALLEPHPGVPPTPAHLSQVTLRMRELGIPAVLTAPWSNGATVERVCETSGARALELPTMVGGAAGVETWIQLIDHQLSALSGALLPQEDTR